MLAKPYRLTSTEDFERVKTKGKKVTSPILTLLYKKAKNEQYPRFGIIVSTKVSKQATARNRVSRAISEGVRQNIYSVDKNYDCIVIARPQSCSKSSSEIMHTVQTLIREADIIKK